jgi:hypothetical protein
VKALLLNSITKIMNYTKYFITKTTNNIKFEGNKNGVIKVMYSPILENKRKEQNMLLIELNSIKEETGKLNRQINIIKEENAIYNKRINALNSFQDFLWSSR